MTVPPHLKAAEDVEMRALRKGKSHDEAERAEKRFLANRRGSGSMFPGFRNLTRGGKR